MNALLKGLGAVLEQEDEKGNLRLVAYASRSLSLSKLMLVPLQMNLTNLLNHIIFKDFDKYK